MWSKALGITEQMESISDDNRDLIKYIREKDNIWTLTQGYIYVPLIEEHREAVERLSNEVTGSAALLGVERGGGMLAEQIPHDKRIIIEHQFGENADGEIVRKKGLETAALMKALRTEAIASSGAETTISIAETVVGGGSATGLIKALNESNILEDFPNLTVKLLLLQQTLHSTEDADNAEAKIARKVDPGYDELDRERGNVKMFNTPTGKLQVVLSSTSYILGEDVDYQLAKGGNDSKKPVILFNVQDSALKIKRITPEQETTSRDILLMLTKGELDSHINDMR